MPKKEEAFVLLVALIDTMVAMTWSKPPIRVNGRSGEGRGKDLRIFKTTNNSKTVKKIKHHVDDTQ